MAQRPCPGVRASVHVPTPAEPGRKWLEAPSLGVNCLHSKSLYFFLEKHGSMPKKYLARLKWTAARLLEAWGFLRQQGFQPFCPESGRILVGSTTYGVMVHAQGLWRCCLTKEKLTLHWCPGTGFAARGKLGSPPCSFPVNAGKCQHAAPAGANAPCLAQHLALEFRGCLGWNLRKSLEKRKNPAEQMGRAVERCIRRHLGECWVGQCESWSQESLARHGWSEAVLVSGQTQSRYIFNSCWEVFVPQVMSVHVSGVRVTWWWICPF